MQFRVRTVSGTRRRWRAAVVPACFALAAMATPAAAQVPGARAEPYPAWPEPTLDPTLSIGQAKQIVTERTQPQTKWLGPTSGPKAIRKPLTIAWVSADQSYTAYIYWGNGIKDAASKLGW